MGKIKKIIKHALPPFMFDTVKLIFSKYGFSGNYQKWTDAQNDCSGYDDEAIIKKVKKASLKVKNGEAVFERDGLLYDKIQYSYPLLASLLWTTSKNNNELNIVDFGGSLGSNYFQNKKMLAHANVKWNIVEQEKFVHYGKEKFTDETLKFFYNIDECFENNKPNSIMFSGSIQYIEKPFDVLQKVVDHKFEYIIFDRVSFSDIANDVIVMQNIPPHIYKASYPCWLFDEEKFIKFFTKNNYKLFEKFDNPDVIKYKNKNIKFKALIFELKK